MMFRIALIFAAAMAVSLPTFADTNIGVVDLRQALSLLTMLKRSVKV
jgi:hypothetical protein